MSLRIYGSEKVVVTCKSKLLQNKRRRTEKSTYQQLQFLQKNVSTSKN